ncbi:Mth938-like domain-containing protein [Maritimibacter alkaliphilus]|uniref:Mth938-like domain-containing protein n=1 Tax=Maritimibacter alkaliphilus TaxID=404236 RepID=UPI001C985AB6|nr:Mth938-like domain-containing protein [Maritimibacter alkaliphilus]MBY6092731.1 Mth938-like domain-containing protein [Maritimibacter alkaliphilus]
MRLNEIDYGKARPIDGYGPGFFRVGGEVVHGPCLVTADSVETWTGFDDRQALLDLAGQVDVIFIGMGADIAHAPADLVTELRAAGLGVETMSSPSACRTFNVLLSEARRVAAALLPV